MLAAVSSAFAFLGRYGTQGFALSILLGLALPQFAAAARPLLPVTIFCFTTVVFMRADLRIIGGLLRRPARLIGVCVWLALAPAAMIALVLGLVGREAIEPGLLLGIALLGAAPPVMSTPAVAIMYGIEPSLLIAGVVVTTLLTPLLGPLLLDLLAGTAVELDRTALMIRLALFIGGAIVLATVLRLRLGLERVRAMKAELDGFGVLMYFVFAVAAMDGVTRAAFAAPAHLLMLIAIGWGCALAGIVLGFALLVWLLPAPQRMMVGYGTGQRNIGLVLSALGPHVPPTTYLFFAVAQFPIYLLPWLLRGVAARVKRAQGAADAD